MPPESCTAPIGAGNPAANPTATATRWWGFLVYGVIAAVHIGALGLEASDIAGPTKLLLMPALALAVIWALGDRAWTITTTLLLVAILFSWIGDGAGTFFPFFDDELPMMLLFFGLAHLVYIWLFQRPFAVRRQPWWSLVYVAWWAALLLILWPHLGALAIAVAAYGVVLGGTAASAARCNGLIVVGSILFLSSDSILAFRIFMTELMPAWTSPLVMLTYCAGQGLIAVGAVLAIARNRSRSRSR